MVNLQNALNISHLIMGEHLMAGSVAVDGTMGKGRDTLFLSTCVGDTGRVYAFDIQESAVTATHRLLDAHAVTNTVLILDSHEHIKSHVNAPIDGAMFNLGYLPGGEHTITTLYPSTIKAVEACMSLLNPKGIITVCVYYGHGAGAKEKEHLLEFVQHIDPRAFAVSHLQFVNQPHDPPFLLFIQKNFSTGRKKE